MKRLMKRFKELEKARKKWWIDDVPQTDYDRKTNDVHSRAKAYHLLEFGEIEEVGVFVDRSNFKRVTGSISYTYAGHCWPTIEGCLVAETVKRLRARDSAKRKLDFTQSALKIARERLKNL